jgi:hypothetical protein
MFKQDNEIFIPHLSPSTVNSFIMSRHSFYSSKVKRNPFTGNKYTSRGTAVEHGVNTWIDYPQLNPLDAALNKFDEELLKGSTTNAEAEEVRESIPGLLNVALGFYKGEFEKRPARTQQKMELQIDGISRTIVGYYDYLQDVAVRDCKVTSKTPTALSQSYIIQGSVYAKATGLPVFFDFFVPNKKPTHKEIQLSLTDYKFGISYFTRACEVLEELQECDQPKRIIELMSFPDLSSMYSLSEKKDAAKAWGIKF